MKLRGRDQKGFTLIELVVVIAILGVLAAVTVPLVTNYLNSSKARGYSAEKSRIQDAVDAYFSSPDNTKYLGKPQYPIIGRAQTNQGTLTNRTTAVSLIDNGDPFTAQDPDGAGPLSSMELWNPLGGQVGANISAAWSDTNADGIRTVSATSGDFWAAVSVTRGGVTYRTDARYYFIDFEALVTASLLSEVPQSASTDNKPESSTTTYSGSYSWYVDNNGKVQSLWKEYPTSTNNGFVTGAFP